MHEVYIAMELTIYIFNFNPSINEIVFIASKKKERCQWRDSNPSKWLTATAGTIFQSTRCFFHYSGCFICDPYMFLPLIVS